MAEEKELTGIERELVLQYLRDDNVPLTVTLEEKPAASEVNMDGNKTLLPLKSERISTGTIFPVAIKSQQMTVLNQGIILLKNDVKTVEEFLGKKVRVQFYFNRLGLYFITTMKECSQGLALVIPASIKRIPDIQQKQTYDFKARLSFISDSSTEVNIFCTPLEEYELFTTPKWGDIVLEKQKEAKAYLEKFVFDSRQGKGDPVGNGVHLFPVVRFLTDNFSSTDAFEGRVKPLSILYVDDKKILLASRQKGNGMVFGAEYKLALEFTLKDNSLIKRVINTSCKVVNEYTKDNDENTQVFVCKYGTLKEEDKRFLYERVSGKKISE